MLRTTRKPVALAARTARLSQRGLFDYVREKQAKAQGVAVTREAPQWNWDFIERIRKIDPKAAAHYDKMKTDHRAVESRVNEPVKPTPPVDFEAWRKKVAHPTIVDELEAKYTALAKFVDSKPTMEQALTWSQEVRPRLLNGEAYEETSFQESLKRMFDDAEKQDHYDAELYKELSLDYEQLEAERDMFGFRAETMDLAEHPSAAEQLEETSTGRQTFMDYVLSESEWYRFIKRERLQAMQDEAQKQLYLDTRKDTSIIYGFEEAATEAKHH